MIANKFRREGTRRRIWYKEKRPKNFLPHLNRDILSRFRIDSPLIHDLFTSRSSAYEQLKPNHHDHAQSGDRSDDHFAITANRLGQPCRTKPSSSRRQRGECLRTLGRIWHQHHRHRISGRRKSNALHHAVFQPPDSRCLRANPRPHPHRHQTRRAQRRGHDRHQPPRRSSQPSRHRRATQPSARTRPTRIMVPDRWQFAARLRAR